MDKEDVVYMYNEIKKNEVLPFTTTWMDLEGVMLNEISLTEKDTFHMISVTCDIYNMI